MSARSVASNGRFLFWGNNGEEELFMEVSDVPTGIGGRLNTVWRVSESGGDVGAVDMSFDLTGLNLSVLGGNVRLLLDSDGDFSTTDNVATGTFNAVNNTITFANVNLANGQYFSIGQTPTTAPVVVNALSDISISVLESVDPDTINLLAVFSDPDIDAFDAPLFFSATALDDDLLTVSILQDSLLLVNYLPDSIGTDTVVVFATEGSSAGGRDTLIVRVSPPTYYSRSAATNIGSTGATFSDANTWTASEDHTGDPVGIAPNGNPVVIAEGHRINVTSNSALVESMHLLGSVFLGQTSGHTFNEVSGDGTITLSALAGRFNLPSGSYADSVMIVFEGLGEIPGGTYPCLTFGESFSNGVISFVGDVTLRGESVVVNEHLDLDGNTLTFEGENWGGSSDAELRNGRIVLGGSNAISYNGSDSLQDITLEINTSGGVSVDGGLSVSGSLVLTDGILTMGGSLTLTGTGASGGSNASYVATGNPIIVLGTGALLTRLFPFGERDNYLPLQVGGRIGSDEFFRVSSGGGVPPPSADSVGTLVAGDTIEAIGNSFWTVELSGTPSGTYSVSFSISAADNNFRGSVGRLRVIKSDGLAQEGNWNNIGGSASRLGSGARILRTDSVSTGADVSIIAYEELLGSFQRVAYSFSDLQSAAEALVSSADPSFATIPVDSLLCYDSLYDLGDDSRVLILNSAFGRSLVSATESIDGADTTYTYAVSDVSFADVLAGGTLLGTDACLLLSEFPHVYNFSFSYPTQFALISVDDGLTILDSASSLENDLALYSFGEVRAIGTLADSDGGTLGGISYDSLYRLPRQQIYVRSDSTYSFSNLLDSIYELRATVSSFSGFGVGSVDSDIEPLPVELVWFRASVTAEGAVMLFWSTASELNSDRFEIERSIDGMSFSKIGELSSQGNSIVLSEYSYVDSSPAIGLNYYRLKQIDLDGSFVYSVVVSVELSSVEETFGVLLYPNPAIATVNMLLRGLGADNSASYRLYDSYGLVVLEGNVVGDTVHALSLPSNLSSGLYILRVWDGNGAVKRIKLLIGK